MSEQKTENQQHNQQQCGCPMCGGQCPRCRMMGCGMCQNCKNKRCPLCPNCANMVDNIEGYESTEEQINKSPTNFITFDRFVLILIFLLISYIAWKHYKE